jgi:hypothetical protein
MRRRVYRYYDDREDDDDDDDREDDDDDDDREDYRSDINDISAYEKKRALSVWVEKYGSWAISSACLPTSLQSTVRLEFCRQCFEAWADRNAIPHNRRIVVNQSHADTILECTVDANKSIESFDMWSLSGASERERNTVVAALSKDSALIQLEKKERYSVICLMLDEYPAYPAHALAKMADPLRSIKWYKKRTKMHRVIVEEAAFEVDRRVRVIQRAWRTVIVDPGYLVCRRRLHREFQTLNIIGH